LVASVALAEAISVITEGIGGATRFIWTGLVCMFSHVALL
jgi:hypothetical protein